MSPSASSRIVNGDVDEDNDDRSGRPSLETRNNAIRERRALLQAQQNQVQEEDSYGWVIVAVSFIAQLLGYGVSYTLGMYVIAIRKEFPTIQLETVSWIASILIAMTHLAGPFASIMINLTSTRTVSIIGHILTAIGFSLSYFAENVYVLYVTLGLIAGTGLGFIYLPAIVSVAQYFSRRRSLAIGFSVAGSGFGTFVFEWINGYLLAKYPWRTGLLIQGGIIFGCTLLSFLYKPPPVSNLTKIPQRSRYLSYGSIEQAQEDLYFMDTSPLAGCLKTFRKMIDFNLLKNKYFVIFLLADILTSIAFNIPFIFIPSIEETLTKSKDSTLLGIMGVSSVISRLLIGCICDMKFINRHFLYAACLFIAGLSTLLSPILHTMPLLQGYSTIFGFGIGGYMCLTSLVLVDILTIEKLNDAYGILLFVQAIGFFIGLPVVAFFYDTFGNFDIGFYFAGALIIVTSTVQCVMAIVRRFKNSSYTSI